MNHRFEPDMLAFSGCYYGGGEKEKFELGEIRKRWETLPVRFLSFMTLWFKFTEKLLVPWILEVIFGLKVLDKLCGLFAFLCLHVIVSSIYLEKCLLRWILMHLFGLCNLAISMFVHMML